MNNLIHIQFMIHTIIIVKKKIKRMDGELHKEK